MPRTPLPATPERNRLRAAAGLIPIIESGLQDGKLSPDRAKQMADFCEWALSFEADDPRDVGLQATVRCDLNALKARFIL